MKKRVMSNALRQSFCLLAGTIVAGSALLPVAPAHAGADVFGPVDSVVRLFLDGREIRGGWNVAPEINPDILETAAARIAFVSKTDTLAVSPAEWDSADIAMITTSGDTARVRVIRTAANPYEHPSPQMSRRAASGKLTREQARFDIDALVYGISQIHPDIYSVCTQEQLLRAVNQAKDSLGDSVTTLQLYRAAAPLVAMIGDGHTCLQFPYKDVFTDSTLRMPVFVRIGSDRAIICESSIDSVIPYGSAILSINGVPADTMIDAMMPYVSGERQHYKLVRVGYSFYGLFHMLYGADAYDVEYRLPGESRTQRHIFPAATRADIISRCPSVSRESSSDYTFSIDRSRDVAVMDFRSFTDAGRMSAFADSMFTSLRDARIGNLIIDLRANGGGNSAVGDVLLRYISPLPFVQMEKALIRVTPLSARLIGNGVTPCLVFHQADSADYIRPLSRAEGHYDGRVYLLTSNNTFSSASSFAWVFKECGVGPVVGEETGGMSVSYGDLLVYSMPVSGLSTTVSYKRFWLLHADERDIHGVIPDVPVKAPDALDTALEMIARDRGR